MPRTSNSFARSDTGVVIDSESHLQNKPLVCSIDCLCVILAVPLLHPMVKKMHLQENTLFDLDLWIKVTRNVAQYPGHHVTYAPAKIDVATSHG